ncbi:MAG TPA: M13 family peptidase, partial [Candidatus Yonathbacteria bacterium]|nr:M13 family peptidase [Candidatus Yonathbacteria bacterium]
MKGTAINKKDFNEKVRPQDDFFEYSNGGWIKRTKIPAVESRWGTFYIVRDRNRKRVQGLIEENAKKRAKKVSDEQKMRDLYLLNLDTKRRNKEGVAPLQEYLTKINKIEYIETLLSAITELHRIGIDVPWAIYIDQDDKDSDKLVLRFHQSGLGMPSRDYYLKKDKESVRVKNAYKKHIVSVHRLLGQSPQEAGNNMNIIMEMESAIARVSMTNVELRDIPAQYNKKTIAELSRLVSAVDIKKYLKEMGIPVLRSVIVDQPEFMSGVNKLISTRPLNDWRVYLTWHLVNGYAGALSDKFVKENFNFYTTVILGVKKMRSQKERAAIAVGSGLGELVGKIYISKYFPNKAKQEVNKLIDNITIAYKKRIKNLDWMSDATKKKALNKLDTVVRKVGFPDTWKSHKSLLIDQKLSYAKNLMAIEKFYWKREVHKLGRPVDKKEWHMTPQTVNAYYSFATNSINFPAGILQPPFFDIDGDSAVNYGAMGAIIGHELSHGFDDMGSQFDGNGNRKNWWTKKDKQKFD